MDTLLIMDEHNYKEDMPEFRREAVRGIIVHDHKLLMTETKVFNELKLPGGGVDPGESYEEALVREVLEETGRHIIRESVKEFGFVEEKRKSMNEEKIWHQFNYYYLAEVDDVIDETNYTENEKKYQFHPLWIDIDEAIRENEEMINKQGKLAWNEREYRVLKIIKERLESL